MPRAALPPADFIEDLLQSIARRHKALKHKLRAISVERVADRVEDVERRKLEIIFTKWGSPSPVIEIFAWDDRWISLDVSHLQDGRIALDLCQPGPPDRRPGGTAARRSRRGDDRGLL